METKDDVRSDKFYTGNLNVVAYLKTKGVDYTDVKVLNGSKLFGFTKSETFEETMSEYNNNHFLKTFLKNLRLAKDVVKSGW